MPPPHLLHASSKRPVSTVSHAMQACLHAARPALSRRARSAAVHVNGEHFDADASVLPALYPLVACMAVCLPCLEELSLDLGERLCYDEEEESHPSVFALLAGSLPHLARLSVSYPGWRTTWGNEHSLAGGAGVEVFQASPGMTFCMPVPSKTFGAIREATCALCKRLRLRLCASDGARSRPGCDAIARHHSCRTA